MSTPPGDFPAFVLIFPALVVAALSIILFSLVWLWVKVAWKYVTGQDTTEARKEADENCQGCGNFCVQCIALQ
jgi:hypothetical protein